MAAAGPVFVAGGGGTRIATYEYGNPDGAPLVLIHGFNQCHLCWERQFTGPLADQCRIVAVDLRGHGNSEKPAEPEAYQDQAIWAEDIAAVIAAHDLKKPVLAGWSYAGHVLCAYVGAYGTGAIAGLAFVGAITVAGTDKTANVYLPEMREVMQEIVAADAYRAVDAVLAFLDLCFEVPPDPQTFARIVAYNMLVPYHVRRALRGRTLDSDHILQAIDVPTLVIHGERDRVVLPWSGRHIAGLAPGSELKLYEGIGHSPFFEAADRFNSDLATFVRTLAP